MRNDVTVETQYAIHKVGTANDPLEACEVFQANADLLKDWRIIYAAEEGLGPFKLRRSQFSEKGFVSTAFRGKSLWVLDSDVITTTGSVPFRMGTGTFLDSNAASFIRALAYLEKIPDAALTACKSMSEHFSLEELSRLNPYFYLWEGYRSKNIKTIQRTRETIAAILAIPLIKKPFDIDWGIEFRSTYRAQAEASADEFLYQFYREMDKIGEPIESQVDIVESILVRTMILEYSSNKAAHNKLEALVQFLHEELSTIMIRELIVCADILCREGKSQLSKKLNSLPDKKNPLATIRNCAWDLFLLRAMDQISNTSAGNQSVEFYIPNLITFDDDLSDILQLAELRAIAIHRTSSATFPIFDESMSPWLEMRVGEKKMSSLIDLFSDAAFNSRTKKRDRSHIRSVLQEDRSKLMDLISKNKSK
ncbi:hypothetical protein [Chromobacterium violaceum]|uniref:hypothetical protein n=1 Tax=Chromobacterium violaceum TaxID=536 RepID=UPI001B31D0AD|nr:hypothetical protein [Chromobacterium violaceum]MBP4047765.1 hypothetical protein [Chromobacterium violaceum]